MFNTIIKALENFCIHQIREEYIVNDFISDEKMIINYIDINPSIGGKYRVYIASDFQFMQKIATLFLEEVQSDEETLVDMTLETTNLIVGSAKVIAEELQKNLFTIETPHFIKIDRFDLEYDEIKTIQIAEDRMMIAIKEIDDNS
ncbi:MAG: chemotaxis protein CheX [Campylobacterota bacterium]|nr:chemotaxis protein CheX [Campylobacterota bacterium]